MKLKEFITKALKITALGCFVAATTFQVPIQHRKYLRNLAEENVVQIFGDNGAGTGAHVQLEDGRIVILTNKHICQMEGELRVKSSKIKEPIVRKRLVLSKKHDLCAIEAIPGHSGLKLGEAPQIGEQIYTMGHPRAEALNVTSGEYFFDKVIELGENIQEDGTCAEGRLEMVMDIFGPIAFCVVKRETMQVDTPTYPGNSGSPVVNKYGELVAVVFAGDRTVENQGFLVPTRYVSEFLSEI